MYSIKIQNTNKGHLVKFEFQMNNVCFFKYKYVPCNIWDILKLNEFHSLSENQI